jgi:putative membrane protein
MLKFLLRWLISALVLIVVMHIFSGVSSDNLVATLVMALVLGLLNTFLKPVLMFLSFPLMILSLGFFTLIINGVTFYLAAKLVHGFYVAGFWSAFGAALIYSILTFFINLLIRSDDEIKNLHVKVFYRRG